MSGVLLVGGAGGLVLRASLLIALGWLVAVALRKASAATRSLSWLLCMGSLLALPFLCALLPAFDVPVLPPAATGAAGGPSPEIARLAGATSQAPLDWSAIVPSLYLLGAGLLLLRLLVARNGLASLWRESRPADDPEWRALLAELSAGLGLSREVRLGIAGRPVMPMTWGSAEPRVLLPAEAGSWSTERRRQVLLHELAHVARFDSLGRSISSIACALYWFHPWAWLAARQLRLEQEFAADNLVLAAGEPAANYACSLVELANELGGGRHAVAATMAGKWQLERRIMAMASPTSRAGPGAFGLSAVAVVATLASALIAPVRSLHAPGPPLPPAAARIAPADGPAPALAVQAHGTRQQPPSGPAIDAPARPFHDVSPPAPAAATPIAAAGSAPPSEQTAAFEAPTQQAPAPVPAQASLAANGARRPDPTTAEQEADYRWHPVKDPPRSSGDSGAGDNSRRPFRLPIQIVSSRLGNNPTPLPPPTGSRTTMVSLLLGAQL